MFAPFSRARSCTTFSRATRSAALACATRLAAVALLAAPALAFAQSTPDPVTGTWAGHIGRGIEPNYSVTLELHLEGTSVRGTMNTVDGSGKILSGTYDPASGALYVGLARAGEQAVSLGLEGVAVQGVATGRVIRGQSTGTFVLRRKGASPGEPGANAGSVDRAQLRSAFEELNGHIVKTAALVPADRFAWRPAGTVRTVGQIVGHVADAYLYYCGRAADRPVQWSDAIAEGGSDKPALIAKLNEGAVQCSAAFVGGNLGPLVVNYGHANLHYGNLVIYLRLLGLIPPTSG